MKYLIVGLGNVGAEYDQTRHNIGFDVVDAIAKELNGSFETQRLGDVAEVKIKGRTLVLLKPSTYMNLSGKAVSYWLQKKKVKNANLLVILDDLNLPFGKLRIKPKGRSGGHNGLKSIEEVLGSDLYTRLRFGIGSEYSKGNQVDFVLGKWSEEERKGLDAPISKASDCVKSLVSIGLERTMSLYNKK